MTFDFDVEEALASLKKDEVMAGVIDRIGAFEMQLKSFEQPCESVTRSIVYQAISSKAAKKIFERLQTVVGETFDHDDILQLDHQALRDVGLSGAKSNAILGVAQAMRDGAISSDRPSYDALENDEIVAMFTSVKGIGTWTAQMILMFSLGRADVMPDGDLGIREGYRIAFELDERPTPREVRDGAATWAPFRTVAAWYLWRVVDQENGGAF